MFKSIFTAAVFSVAIVSPLLAVGCSSATQSEPYALTGASNGQYTAAQVMRYSDQKGRFHPEWVNQPGH